MHCVYLGVVKQLVGIWFNWKHSGQKWYCGDRVEKVDKCLLEIKPPSMITIIPRSIQHHGKFWKDNTAVTSQQCLPAMIKDIPPGHTKDMVSRLCGHTDRTNWTHLRNELYAIGALKKGTPGEPFEDDLLLFLGVESIGCVTFYKRLQIGDAVFHSELYKRVSRRNSFTVAYTKGKDTSYEQIQVFFLLKEDPRVTCGAIIAPMSKSNELICESHVVLGSIVDHIVPLHQAKKNRFDIAPFEDIIYVCLYMKFSDSEVGYAAHFPNHFEKDWTLF